MSSIVLVAFLRQPAALPGFFLIKKKFEKKFGKKIRKKK
jgi:hypothetical protein